MLSADMKERRDEGARNRSKNGMPPETPSSEKTPEPSSLGYVGAALIYCAILRIRVSAKAAYSCRGSFGGAPSYTTALLWRMQGNDES